MTERNTKRGRRNGIFAVGLVGLVAGMVGLAYASVPLYKLFCQVTGYGGTPKINVVAGPDAGSKAVIEVRFDANTNRDLPWKFKAAQSQMKVRLGEPNLAIYKARNLSRETVSGTAVFNVTPYKVAQYFSKIECFCFTEQTLKAGESADMPVQFFVDPAIFEDPDTKEVRAITLSYTFFRSDNGEKRARLDAEKTSIKG